MTLLTGDFAIDSLSAEHRSLTGAISKPAADLPDDARLYLRHVEEGQSIRALARSEGCHASTILRRIRRFEARRDDPLVDGALTDGADRPRQLDDRQVLRILRRLAEPGAVLVTADSMDKAIISRDDIRTAVLDRWIAEVMALKGWVVPSAAPGRVQRYAIARRA